MANTPISASNIRVRRSYARTPQTHRHSNLIELQKRSYESFLQRTWIPIEEAKRG